MQAREDEIKLLKLMGKPALTPLVELLKYHAHSHYHRLANTTDVNQMFRFQGGIATLEDLIRLVEGVNNGS